MMELQHIFATRFSLGNMGDDITNKFAFISLVIYLQRKLQEKQRGITTYNILQKIFKDSFGDDILRGWSILIDSFAYQCKTESIPTFGLKDNEIIPKLKKLMENWFPF